MSDPSAGLKAYFDHLAERAEAAAIADRPRRSDGSLKAQHRTVRRLAAALIGLLGLTAGILLATGSDDRPRIATAGPKASTALPGEIVAVTTDRRLVVMSSADRRVIRVLAEDALAEGKDADGSTSLSVTPDGQTVYFMRQPADCMTCASIAAVPTAGGSITNPLGAGCCIRSPAVSPDGRWLAFTGVPNRSDAGRAILVRALDAASGGTEDRYWSSEAPLSIGIVNLSWAPDSRHLAFVQADAADCKCLRRLDIDAPESTLLDHAPRIEIKGADGMSSPVYLGETGQMLAVSDVGDVPGESLTGAGKPLRIVAIDPKTAKVTRTLSDLDFANQPVADPSGAHILVRSANALYRWSEGDEQPTKIADDILAAQWVPSSIETMRVPSTSQLHLDAPGGIAVAPDGSVVIADGDRIVRRRPNGATEVLNTNLLTPSGLAVAPDGTVYFAEESADRVRALSIDGEVRTIATMNQPRQVAIGPNGLLYVAQSERVTTIDPAGNATTVIVGGPSTNLGGDAIYLDPGALAIGPDGSLFTSDLSPKLLVRFDGSGRFVDKWDLSVGQLGGLATAPDGSIVIANYGRFSIDRITDGEVITIIDLTDARLGAQAGFRPAGVAVGPDGKIYAIYPARGVGRPLEPQLIAIDPQGQVTRLDSP